MKISLIFFISCLLSLTSPLILTAQIKGDVLLTVPESFQDLKDAGIKAMQKNGIQGFRLQLFSGKKNEADLLRKEFMEKYPGVGAYIVFEIPNYKLHVGDFRLKIEAEGFREKISDDFRGAFVLNTSITPFLPKED